MKLLSISDLCARWNYTRAGVHKLVRSQNFPEVSMTVSCGRVKLFSEEAIHHYEKEKPWLFNEQDKKRRQRLFHLLQSAKNNPEQREAILKTCFGDSAKAWH